MSIISDKKRFAAIIAAQKAIEVIPFSSWSEKFTDDAAVEVLGALLSPDRSHDRAEALQAAIFSLHKVMAEARRVEHQELLHVTQKLTLEITGSVLLENDIRDVVQTLESLSHRADSCLGCKNGNCLTHYVNTIDALMPLPKGRV